MQGHAVAPDGGAALDDHKRAAGDGGQWRERLGGGDGRGDGDGVDDGGDCHLGIATLMVNNFDISFIICGSLFISILASALIFIPGMIVQL